LLPEFGPGRLPNMLQIIYICRNLFGIEVVGGLCSDVADCQHGPSHLLVRGLWLDKLGSVLRHGVSRLFPHNVWRPLNRLLNGGLSVEVRGAFKSNRDF
jgi:hypothetical protein